MRVLISGAGIAGPSLAWFLQRTGARVTIVEKSQALLPHGQNVDIQGSAITAIKRMGLLNEVRKFNTTEQGTQLVDSEGRPFARFPLKQDSTVSPTAEFEILRGDLAAILYRATKDHSNVEYMLGTTIKEVISNDNDVVKVVLSNGETKEFDLLVAADGQWSKVRKQCFPIEDVKVIDKGMYAAYWTVPRIPSDNNWWNVYIGLKSRIVTTRPDPHGTTRGMFTFMPTSDVQKRAWQQASRSDRKIQTDLLKQEFKDAGWQSQRLLSAVNDGPDFYFQKMEQIKMRKWSTSRVVCLGDAAHAPTPLTGMGTSLAITGAYVLAGELSELKTGEHLSKALDAYESRFRPFVEKIQGIPSFVPSVAHPGTAWKRWLLKTFVATLAKLAAIPWLASRLPTPESNDDGFPLPAYRELADEETMTAKQTVVL